MTSNEMLLKACRLGDLKSAETLILAGVNPNQPYQRGQTPLYYAALFNHNDLAVLLLAHGADPDIRARGDQEFAQTPLQVAVSQGNSQLASLLIAAGARVDAKSETGRTALHFAVVGSHLDLLRLLIDKGADVNARDIEGTSSLDDAVWRGYLEAAAILLANGARLNEPETKTGATVINEAAYRGSTKLVRYLLQFNPDLKLTDKRGRTPLENAIDMGNANSALVLLEAAQPEQKTPDFIKKMLAVAIRKNEGTVLEALIRHGARPNDALPTGEMPLNAAAAADAIEATRLLLDHGANPNETGRSGTSPLEDASLRGFERIVTVLLDHGAQLNHVNADSGTTALYAAASFQKSSVVELLLKRGADPNACGQGHITPLKSTLENGYPEIAKQIRQYGGTTSCKLQ